MVQIHGECEVATSVEHRARTPRLPPRWFIQLGALAALVTVAVIRAMPGVVDVGFLGWMAFPLPVRLALHLPLAGDPPRYRRVEWPRRPGRVGLYPAGTVVEAGGMARTGLVSRTWRRLGLDANPLRRTADRIQAWTTVALLAVLVTVGPVLAVYVGRDVYRGGTAVERTQRLERFRTEAVLTQDARLVVAGQAAVAAPKVLVEARWTGPEHTVHGGLISVAAGTRAGRSVTLWTDASGEPVEAPLRRDQVTGQAVVAGALAMSAAITLVGTARLVLGRLLDRRRLAAWQAEWSIVGPAWSGRR